MPIQRILHELSQKLKPFQQSHRFLISILSCPHLLGLSFNSILVQRSLRWMSPWPKINFKKRKKNIIFISNSLKSLPIPHRLSKKNLPHLFWFCRLVMLLWATAELHLFNGENQLKESNTPDASPNKELSVTAAGLPAPRPWGWKWGPGPQNRWKGTVHHRDWGFICFNGFLFCSIFRTFLPTKKAIQMSQAACLLWEKPMEM